LSSAPALWARLRLFMQPTEATMSRFMSSGVVGSHIRIGLVRAHLISDLRDPSTTPLNFTKSINLALSERGINAMRHAGQPKLIEHVMTATIPMRGRMIHGSRPNGELYEEPQDYDVHGRVCFTAKS